MTNQQESDYKKLKISAYNKDLYFISYLTDSDIIYEMKDQQLPFVPTSFNNDSMATRVMEKAKFTFDVFSKHRDECIQNYKNLQFLLNLIKPSYWIDRGQFVPSPSNVTGFFKLKFPGMPLLNRDEITLHLTSFNYNINKDTGYLEVDKSVFEGNASEKKLIPISYKISIEGKVLLRFEDTVHIIGAPAQPSQASQGSSGASGASSSGSAAGGGGATAPKASGQGSTQNGGAGSNKAAAAEARRKAEAKQRARAYHKNVKDNPVSAPSQSTVTQAGLQDFINTTSRGMFTIDPDQAKASVHGQDDVYMGLSEIRNRLNNSQVFTKDTDGYWRFTGQFDASNKNDLAVVDTLNKWAAMYGVKINIK